MSMGQVHVHAPQPSGIVRRVQRCTRCKVRRRFVVKQYEWYGTFSICCGCGTTWSDGERCPDSAAGRAKHRDRARTAWATAAFPPAPTAEEG
jgi:hypothetical protein